MSDAYYHTKASVAEYIQAAKGFNGSELIKELVKVLPKSSSLLEIGSGPGSDWILLSKLYEVVGSDLSKEFLNHLTNTYPTGRFLELDAVTLLTEDKFDGIYSNKVLHHLTNEELLRSIKRQQELLNDQGIICHSFWKGEGDEVFKGLFVNYHTEANLKDIFDPYFDILSLSNYAEFEEGDSILLIGRKK